MSAEPTARVLVVDDHPMFRAGLAGLVDDLSWAEVVGESGDGADAVSQVESLQPDIVLMDLHMPGMNGLEATRLIQAAHPEIGVLVMTMVENDEAVAAALRAGARGYLVKGASSAEIARALEAVRAGELILGASVTSGVLGRLSSGSDGLAPFPSLTDREREVLELMARGLDNSAIARKLFLSEKTVRNISSAIFGKLEVGNRAAAVAAARDAGLGGSGL